MLFMQRSKQKKCEVSTVCQLAHTVNTIIYRAKNEKIDLTPMKLQKILYFVYKEYYKKNGVPLFPERFEAWEYGPVVSDVYFAYKKRKSKKIEDYMLDAEGKYQMVDLSSHPRLCEALNDAWNQYKGYTGIELSKITHQRNSAWWKAVYNGSPYLKDEDIGSEKLKTN